MIRAGIEPMYPEPYANQIQKIQFSISIYFVDTPKCKKYFYFKQFCLV